jgi:acyl carrier protein
MSETISRHNIERKVVDIVASALDHEPSGVELRHSLIDDLGAESIDFLDIQFRIESGFGIRIPEDEIWKGALDLTDERWVRGSRLTDEGRARLEELQPDFPWERFPDGAHVRDFPRLVTVETIVAYLEQGGPEAKA